MKSFKNLIETVYIPKDGPEREFWDKHAVDKRDYPNAATGQFTSDKKKAKRLADRTKDEEERVYEAATLHTKRADKEAIIVRAVDPNTGESKARVIQRRAGEIKIGEEVDLDEANKKNQYIEVTNKFTGSKSYHEVHPTKAFDALNYHRGLWSTGKARILVGKDAENARLRNEEVDEPYAVGMAAAMKQTGDTPPLKKSTINKAHEIAKSIKKEAMDPVGKHDADIDNDGDTDKSDKYLIKRRRAIARAIDEGHGVFLKSGSFGENRSSKPIKVHANIEDAEKQAKRLNSYLSAREKGYYGLKYHVKPVAEGFVVVDLDEETDLDEVSMDTLKSYHGAAKTQTRSIADRLQKFRSKDITPEKGEVKSMLKTYAKRLGGMHLAKHKAGKGVMGEEVEDLDEVSKEKLGSYIKKAAMSQIGNTATAIVGNNDDTSTIRAKKRLGQRQAGITRATDRLTREEVEDLDEQIDLAGEVHKAKTFRSNKFDLLRRPKTPINKKTGKAWDFHVRGKKEFIQATLGKHPKPNLPEEVEDLDELSKKTLGSYVRKSADDLARKQGDISSIGTFHPDYKGLSRLRKNRRVGIAKATDRLTREEVEDLDEVFKVGAMHLEDGSSVTLNRENVDCLNNLFNQLNSSNKAKMEERLKSSKNGFNEIMGFAKEIE
jgi:hypothetical protein